MPVRASSRRSGLRCDMASRLKQRPQWLFSDKLLEKVFPPSVSPGRLDRPGKKGTMPNAGKGPRPADPGKAHAEGGRFAPDTLLPAPGVVPVFSFDGVRFCVPALVSRPTTFPEKIAIAKRGEGEGVKSAPHSALRPSSPSLQTATTASQNSPKRLSSRSGGERPGQRRQKSRRPR